MGEILSRLTIDGRELRICHAMDTARPLGVVRYHGESYYIAMRYSTVGGG